VKRKSTAWTPVIVCTVVSIFAGAIECIDSVFDGQTVFSRMEWMTYDWRARQAAKSPSSLASNLGFVAITDDSIQALLDGSLPYRFGLHWPRQVHGRLLDELTRQQARAVAFDIVFAELRPDHPLFSDENRQLRSDHFLADRLRAAGNVILAGDHGLLPHDLFRTNAWAVADISARREVDGVLRRVRAFADVFAWHPMIAAAARQSGGDLAHARIEGKEVLIEIPNEVPLRIALAEGEKFDSSALKQKILGAEVGPAGPRWEKAFSKHRLWQMGILLAARELNLDLSRAAVDRDHGTITLPGTGGVRRVIPVDRDGRLFIDWSIKPSHPVLTKEVVESLLDQYEARRDGRPGEVTNRWKDKLVVIGSTATGNDLTDLGATPLDKETPLLTQHWNVANSVITGRFVRPPALPWRLLLIAGLAGLAGLATWRLRTLHAVALVAGVAAGYTMFACAAFVAWRWLLPVVLPVTGSLLATHVCLVICLARIEQQERRRTRAIFSKVVSPDVVRELLDAETLSLDGARRHMTVFFADVRGFTQITDAIEHGAEQAVAARRLSPGEAASFRDAKARQVLETVNLYLSTVADQVKKHGGTLDKYIGDCVMAFWGAPVEDINHASRCVRAVIDAQLAIARLNASRAEENRRREAENPARVARGETPLDPLLLLQLGCGINTGVMTVGLMGSDAHLLNYTVFGREVNLASRLEGAAGHGRILIGGQTHAVLREKDPALAGRCVLEPPLVLKGFHDEVRCYSVPWRNGDAPETAD
jgi:class 3 adenylate cyclase/CHASE2 domain-containing sensor protein